MAKGFLKTAEFKQLPEGLDKMRSTLDELQNARKKDKASLKDSYMKILAEIKALREELNQIFDNLKKKTVEQLNIMMKDLEKSFQDDVESCAKMNDQLKTMMDKINQLTEKNKEINSYIGHKRCQTKLTEAQNLVHKIQGKPEEALRFESDSNIIPFLKTLHNLGATKRADNGVRRSDSGQMYKVQESKQFIVKINKDEKCCKIRGICELPTGELVIADRKNKRVKLLNTQYQVIAHCDLPASPQHVCHIALNEVAVPIDDNKEKHEIYILTVTRGQFQVSRQFTTDHSSISISHHQGKLYVGSSSALYQYTINGRLVNKMFEDLSDARTVVQSAVSPDGERIYVTNYFADSLITLGKEGQLLSKQKFPELQAPFGLCVSPSGHVFVCWMQSITVVQVDKEGRNKLATIASEAVGFNRPVLVCYSELTSSLIIGNLNQNEIVVIKFS